MFRHTHGEQSLPSAGAGHLNTFESFVHLPETFERRPEPRLLRIETPMPPQPQEPIGRTHSIECSIVPGPRAIDEMNRAIARTDPAVIDDSCSQRPWQMSREIAPDLVYDPTRTIDNEQEATAMRPDPASRSCSRGDKGLDQTQAAASGDAERLAATIHPRSYATFVTVRPVAESSSAEVRRLYRNSIGAENRS